MKRLAICGSCVLLAANASALDLNGNLLDDVWERVYAAGGLTASGDEDRDGFTNAAESDAGTNPFDPLSKPRLQFSAQAGGSSLRFDWAPPAGKRSRIEASTTLLGGSWATVLTYPSYGAPLSASLTKGVESGRFFRLAIDDVDSDGDGLSDYDEFTLRFNPYSANTDRFQQTDLVRVTAGLAAASTVTISALDPSMSERWPEPGLVAVRRSGGLSPLVVNLAYGGTASPGVDYTTTAAGQIVIPAGVREVWIELRPLADATVEAVESITVTVSPGSNYTIGAASVAALTLEDAGAGPSAKEAARFLLQAAFGPDQDSAADADNIPENVEEVMALGFNAWIADQFSRPTGWTQPMAKWTNANGNGLGIYNDPKQVAWWGRVMGSPKLAPDAAAPQLPDPLRQRVAFALSELLVISDRPETLAVEFEGMMNYYDVLVKHSFGNYGDLLREVALHPCMGIYLSHLGNQKADPVNKVYPDENFAREIMQLFSIGLWMLNPDGTRQLDGNGQPIPTYTNADITELARVFTGLSMGGPGNTTFGRWPGAFTDPMKIWDAYHDCGGKTLLRGLSLPARTESAGSTGTAGMADVTAAVDNLFRHPNTGPFVGRFLIQRLVTSNPSPAYIGRVSAAFADNGAGVRGDMKAVIKAVLMDVDARDYAKLSEPTWGRLREPFLRVVNMARAFNATSPSGIYALDAFELDHGQRPLNSPSVFNFFLPNHSPPGPITQAGLAAPEFQIVNASTAVSADNYFQDAIFNGLNRWGVADPQYNVRLDLTQEMALVVPASQANDNVPAGPAYDPDPLLRRLDLALTGGQLSAEQFQIIREALARVPRSNWEWHREYLRMAIFLVLSSPDYCVLR